MESLFVRSLALPAEQQAQCLTSASRTTADGTFAVASADEGVIRVYAASCAALLHEFASIHKRIYALHYTSFSDSLVTLESDSHGNSTDDDDAETFLCVYHDWRERKIVRGYTLPLGVLESPSSRRKADCVAVCSFTGRVVVAMGSVLNIWQCSRGFFEHVLELKVDMAQPHAYLQVEFVAIHGVYVAFASQTEVRVMEIHVRSGTDATDDSTTNNNSSTSNNSSHSRDTILNPLALPHRQTPHGRTTTTETQHVPPDEVDCVTVASLNDLDGFVDVPIPCPSAGEPIDAASDAARLFDEPALAAAAPLVLARDEAQQEAWNLAGLVKSQDLRVNQALAYAVGDRDVHVLLQRFLPPSHRVQALAFLPETIDNQVSVDARSYTRLLVATTRYAFLYYFLSREADATRKHMDRKVFGRSDDGSTDNDADQRSLHRTKSRGAHTPLTVGHVSASLDSDDIDDISSKDDDAYDVDSDTDSGEASKATAADTNAAGATESGRVVVFYEFSAPVASVAANSSFLFVATLAGLQVWSIWSPCHSVAARRALRESLVPPPTQPQLLCTQPTPFPVAQIAALDAYVVLLPAADTQQPAAVDLIRLGSMAAADRLPTDAFELRRSARPTPAQQPQQRRSVVVLEQSPPSLIFAYVRNAIVASARATLSHRQIDLLLSLFSLYRYRADVGRDLLHVHTADNTVDMTTDRDVLALALETKLYDAIAKACAADLAAIFTAAPHRNLARAALLYVASNVSARDVLQRLDAVRTSENSADVVAATSQYLEAFVFPSRESLPTLDSVVGSTSTSASSDDFTRTVLLHYGAHAPEQLARLVIDATLTWSLDDIAFGLATLTAASTRPSARVRIATLVLVLRAASASSDAWTALTDTDTQQQLRAQCEDAALTARVQELLRDHCAALVRVSVTHPELLVCVDKSDDTSRCLVPSAFARVLRDTAPRVLLLVLERVFTRAVRRQDAVFASLVFCLRVVGDGANASIARLTHWRATTRSSNSRAVELTTDASYGVAQCLVLRLLVFALATFPTLEQLADKEELHENEHELRRVKAAVALELVMLSVALCSAVRADDGDSDASPVAATLLTLFARRNAASDAIDTVDKIDTDADTDTDTDSVGPQLPAWVREFLSVRCLPQRASTALQQRLRFVFALALELLQEPALVAPADVVQCFEVVAKPAAGKTPVSTNWRLANDFAALVVLLTLPRLARTVDGLRLIAARADFVSLFLPYGTCHCETLAEWRFLITTLSASSDGAPEAEAPRDEAAILERVLHHVCSTLGPDELLHVLPDDGDLSLYMATIEASVRLTESHARAPLAADAAP